MKSGGGQVAVAVRCTWSRLSDEIVAQLVDLRAKYKQMTEWLLGCIYLHTHIRAQQRP